MNVWLSRIVRLFLPLGNWQVCMRESARCVFPRHHSSPTPTQSSLMLDSEWSSASSGRCFFSYADPVVVDNEHLAHQEVGKRWHC